MSVFRLPKTTRWIIGCSVLLLLYMQLYRAIIFLLFKELFTSVAPGIAPAFLLGILFDLRIVAVITLLIFALSFWPGIHYFKTKSGKLLAVGMFGFSLFFIHFFYAADIIYLKCFGARLNGSLISELAKLTPRGTKFLSSVSWLPMLASTGLLIWLYVFLIFKLHKYVSKSRGTDNTTFRIAWQAGLFIGCVACIHGSIGKKPLSMATLAPKYTGPAVQLAVTPIESLLSTLPKAH